jgi:hypothetical protein
VIDKKVCPYEEVEALNDYMKCKKCTIPEVYMGIRPNVPESHCEAGKYVPAKDNAPYYMDDLYNYMNSHFDGFRKMALDERGRLMVELKKVLDKYNMK